jgi:inner membrane protein
VYIAAAACAALPDIDVLWSPLVSRDSLFAHRAITHSLTFALVVALAVGMFFFRDPRTTIVLLLALVSHSCLDALSSYSRGIEFFAPFSQQRFRFPWTPLTSWSVAGRVFQETGFVLLPALVASWMGFKRRT